MSNHFLNLIDQPAAALTAMLDLAIQLKQERREGTLRDTLKGKTLAMIFEKPSTRTRVSFDVAMRELGGDAMVLQKNDLQLGRGETVADTAQVLSRYVHALMLRANSHSTIEELAQYASIPVINGLTDMHHPCQLMADLMTMKEHLGGIEGKTVVWVGDGNNMCHSWMEAAIQLNFTLRVITPSNFEPKLRYDDHDNIIFCDTPQEAVRDVDVVVTDTWVSMGDDDTLARRQSFVDLQVNQDLMSLAKDSAIFMHCLPAHRGDEVTDAVLDGPQSVVFDEAENRLHVQKAILLWSLNHV
ncbi:MAG: ornithine carbamoyltransferase [Rickettsiales bacterium]|nr:ornithine carbamoyltransferase [Rickettsiales bacterium]